MTQKPCSVIPNVDQFRHPGPDLRGYLHGDRRSVHQSETLNRVYFDRISWLLKLLLLASLIASATSSITYGQAPYQRLVRKFEVQDPGIATPAGLVYSPGAGGLLVAPFPGSTTLQLVTFASELANTSTLPTALVDPVNMAFDGMSNSLLYWDAETDEMIEIKAGADGLPQASENAVTRFDARPFSVRGGRGLTVDPTTGELFILVVSAKSSVPRIVRIKPHSRDRFLTPTVSNIVLNSLQREELQGIAFNPTDGHLYVMAPAAKKLYELSLEGDVLSIRDLGAFGLKGVQNMVFAPSSDQTDDSDSVSLYVADSGLEFSENRQQVQTILASRASGDIVEFSLTETQVLDLSPMTVQGSLVQTILTSQWSPSSPDPSGLAYLPSTNSLLVSDSEVNEMSIFSGVNMWQVTLNGGQIQEFSSTGFSDEPSGIAYNPDNQHLFFADDTGIRRVYELNPGTDGQYNTSDDIVTSFRTGKFSSTDPEGIAYDPVQGHLFIADGSNAEIYEVDPGANGVFDGVPPEGDDVVLHFDTAILGLFDPEGVEFNSDTGTLYIVSRDDDFIVETTRDGTPVSVIDIAFLSGTKLAGLTYAPSSTNPSEKSLYLVDRAVDNNSDPNENDGKIYELSLGSTTPSLTIDDVTIQEGDAGIIDAIFTVTLSSASQQTVTVDYATADGTATTADGDYVSASSQLSFQPGETSKPIAISVNGDLVVEPDENFFVHLANAANATISDDQGEGTVTNDDIPPPLPVLSIDDVSTDESDGILTFTVSLSEPSGQAITVDYASADSTALAGSDYTAVSGTLVIPVDSTYGLITVALIDDGLSESSEVFKLVLSNPSGAESGDSLGLGTITDDDGSGGPPVTVSFQDGVDGYDGTRDAELDSNTPDTNNGSATVLKLDGSPSRSVLISWDVTGIPAGSTVESVDITFNITNATDDTYEVYEMLKPWVENQATWNQYATGQSWQVAGADGATDRGSEVLGSIIGEKGLATFSLNAAGVAVVQSWVDDPSSNQGLVILDHVSASNELDLSSRENTSDWKRPMLTISYSSPAPASMPETKGPELVLEALPESVALSPNYPNPFRQETTIEYALSEQAAVRLTIYNIRGQLVSTLVDGIQEAGSKRVRWDGRDDAGRAVGSGVYMLQLMVDHQRIIGKMVLAK